MEKFIEISFLIVMILLVAVGIVNSFIQLKWWALLIYPLAIIISLFVYAFLAFSVGYIKYCIKFKTLKGYWSYVKDFYN